MRFDGAEVFEFVEEALDEVAVSVEEGAEGWLGLFFLHFLEISYSFYHSNPYFQ